jgi:hypothetical protein
MLTRTEILTAPTRPVVPVECPELGGVVHLRMLSGAEVAHIEREGRTDMEFVQDLVALSLCASDGVRLLTEKGDGKTLYEAHSSFVLEPLVTAALRINRMTKESTDAAKKA